MFQPVLAVRWISLLAGCLLVSAVSMPLMAQEPASASTWPQWRGPARDGVSPGADWPASLNEQHLKLLWRVELNEGYPGPIVAEDRVFVAETKDEKQEIVRALDRRSGAELWQAKWDGSLSVPFFASSNGDWIRSTPAYDGESLYVAGMRDVLVCLNAATGKERWRVDFVERYQADLPAFGFVCSPLVDGDFVYVQAGSGLVKLNKHTGESTWRVLHDEGGMMGSAFSSPNLAVVAGRRQLLVQTRTTLAGVDPEDGKVLWSRDIAAFRGMNIITPAAQGDTILTSAYGGKTTLIRVKEEGSQLVQSTEWEEKSQGYMSSPVFIDGHAYLHLRNQRFACFDLASGKKQWSTRPYGQYCSLVARGDKILALDERGELLLIHANPAEFELLDQRKISEQPAWGHLAVAGGEVFVRELQAIAAYRWKHAE
ncbi:MAG: PQQ-binding-like beta-propeller repeat protein [Pirellulales bacterium]